MYIAARDRDGRLIVHLAGTRRTAGQGSHVLSTLASADALAGDDLGAVQNNWRKGGDDGARASKELTMKTIKNFGQNNASQY